MDSITTAMMSSSVRVAYIPGTSIPTVFVMVLGTTTVSVVFIGKGVRTVVRVVVVVFVMEVVRV